MACVEETAILPMTGAGRVTVDSGVPLTGILILHLRDTGTPIEEGPDPTVLQAVGQYLHLKLMILRWFIEIQPIKMIEVYFQLIISVASWHNNFVI